MLIRKKFNIRKIINEKTINKNCLDKNRKMENIGRDCEFLLVRKLSIM